MKALQRCSATRADFRPGSDIDLLVEPMPGRRLGLAERVGLMADAEQLFGRDVDLVTAPVGRTSLANRVGRDGVVLYDSGAGRLRGRVRPVTTATTDEAGIARERA